MGLDINLYSYAYSTLQAIRRWALTVESNKNQKLMCPDIDERFRFSGLHCGKCIYCQLDDAKSIQEEKAVTKFYELINHSDCDGQYTINPKKRTETNGNLVVLKEEMKELAKHKIPEDIKNAFQNLYKDIMEEKECLEFR